MYRTQSSTVNEPPSVQSVCILLRRTCQITRQVNRLRIDKQVLEAHEAATKALKACREAQGLTVERVEDTLDALVEVNSPLVVLGCLLPVAKEWIAVRCLFGLFQ